MKTRREMPSALIAALLVLPILACGCHKSQRDIAEANAIKRHQQDVARGPMLSPSAWSNYLQTPAGKQATKELLSRPDTKVALAALTYLDKAKKEGRLPGAPRDEPGGFVHQKKAQFGTDGVNYSTVEIRYVTKTVPRTNIYYTLTQVSSNSAPQLQGARRVAPDGSAQEINIQ